MSEPILRGPLAKIAEKARAIDVNSFGLQFSQYRIVANGQWRVRTATPTSAFWDAYRGNKEAIKSLGLSVSKNKTTGAWEVVQFAKPEAEEIDRRARERDMSHAASNMTEFPAPGNLKRFPYQNAGIAYGIRKSGVLIGDSMGLGKSSQAIGIIDFSGAQNALIICPASLKLNWERELNMWLNREMSIGVIRPGKKNWPDTQIVVINYDLLDKYDAEIKSKTWDVVVCDEAHYLKGGTKTKRGSCVFGNRNDGKKPIEAHRRVLLTGTPIANRPAEIWPLIRFLDSQAWSSWPAFAKRYCDAKDTSFGFDAKGASNLDELQDRLRETVMIRRLKEEVLTELPPKTRQLMTLPSTGAEHEIAAELDAYKNMKERIAELRVKFELAKASPVDGEYGAAVGRLKEGVAAAFTEMARQRKAVAIAKLPSLIDHVEEAVASSGKIVVFCHHREVHDALMHHFKGQAVGIIGGDGITARQAAVDKFQRDPDTKVFVGSIMAAGTGITLTASSHVVMGELDWVPGSMVQAEDRCIIQGQRVMTPAGYVPIEEIKVGQVVLGSSGQWRRVLDTSSRQIRNTESVTELSYERFNRPLVTTSDHRILVKRGSTEPDWMHAEDVRPRDMLCFPRSSFGHLKVVDVPLTNGRGTWFVRHESNLVELGNLIGWYLAEGSVAFRNSNECGVVSIVVHENERSQLDRIANYLATFGVNSKIRQKPGKRSLELRACNTKLAEWMAGNFGRGCFNKMVPAWVWKFDRSFGEEIVAAYLEGDGCVDRRGQHWKTASNVLATDIARLAAAIGHEPGLRSDISKEGTEIWTGRYSTGGKSRSGIDDRFVYYKVTEARNYCASRMRGTTVHDLTVEHDHSFVVGLATVHNCHRIGTKSNVLAQWIVLEGSLDSRMAKTLMEKAAVIEAALDKRHETEGKIAEPHQAFAQQVSVFEDEEAATRQAKRDALAKEAELITPPSITVIHNALQFLAALDADGARQKNGAGFGKIDTRVGRELARKPVLSAREACLGLRIANKYKGQLGAEMAREINHVWEEVSA